MSASIKLFFRQSVLSTNINSPIRKLLVLIIVTSKQSFTLFTNILTELVKQRNIMT